MNDLEIAINTHLPEILRRADLEKSTVKTLQKELESKLLMSLDSKKNYIRDQVRVRVRVCARARACVCGRVRARARTYE